MGNELTEHNKETLSDIARKLRRERADQDITQAMLAKKCGIPQPNLSKMEKGEVDMRISTLDNIVQGLGLDLDVNFVDKKR